MYQRPIDLFPVDVYGPLAPNVDQIRYGRLFVRDDRLYIVASPDRGKTVSWVRSYALPEDAPKRGNGPFTRWGPWKYKSCGCNSNWRSQTVDGLKALAVVDQQANP